MATYIVATLGSRVRSQHIQGLTEHLNLLLVVGNDNSMYDRVAMSHIAVTVTFEFGDHRSDISTCIWVDVVLL